MDLNLRNLGGDNTGEASPGGSDSEPNACSASNSLSSSPATSASSSIGKNSDLSERSASDGEDCEENEAQSSYKGPLEMMEALEEVLPIRRGISKFHKGKSKSFTSLGEAASMKDITKPENAYTRKRRNLMAFSQVWDPKNRSFNGFTRRGNISKRPISSSRSTVALAVAAMTSSDSSSSTASDDSSPRHHHHLPPLHPNTTNQLSPPGPIFFSPRSMSLADFLH